MTKEKMVEQEWVNKYQMNILQRLDGNITWRSVVWEGEWRNVERANEGSSYLFTFIYFFFKFPNGFFFYFFLYFIIPNRDVFKL